MRVLILTYPLTAVTDDACGGAEQIALLLLRGLSRIPEFELFWIAAPGSAAMPGVRFATWPAVLKCAGLLQPLPSVLPQHALDDLQRRCQQAALAWLAENPVELVHNQGGFFYGASPCPVLFTLHLARPLYPPDLLGMPYHFQCVSHTQQLEYGGGFALIPNGIDLGQFSPRARAASAGAPLLYLGRICPEKGPHLAIAAARRAGRSLVIAGAVAPFPSHQEYFRRYIEPQLDAQIRWIPPPGARAKRELLAACAAVIVPSQIAETSSLVAMEAAAVGVPTLATRRGALPEIVIEGETGWLADTPEEFAAAVARLDAIAPAACRLLAERAFDARPMVAAYARLYRQLGQPAAPARAWRSPRDGVNGAPVAR
ncbi:MAG: glycosyltransferase [Terriglobales bacterium]